MKDTKTIKTLHNIICYIMKENRISEIDIPEEELKRDREVTIRSNPDNFDYKIKAPLYNKKISYEISWEDGKIIAINGIPYNRYGNLEKVLEDIAKGG